MKKQFTFITLALLLALSLATPVLAQEPTGDFGVIQRAADAWLSSVGKPVTSADALYENLNDGDATNDPLVLSVRGADHYAQGHIAGAINIPWRNVAKAESLAQLPTDKQIVDYCYTGHTGQVAQTVLGVLGYDALNLKFGMMGWTKNDEVLATTRFGPDTLQRDYALETEVNETTDTYDFPVVDTGKEEVEDIIAAAADAYLSSGAKPVMTAEALFDVLNDGDESNDPVVVSVRGPDHYALGHVPGAINIPWKQIAQPENLAKLPPDKQIVVYCYTGHTGQVAATVLNMLGYDAVNLKFGMMGWTENDEVFAQTRFDPTTQPDYPFEGSLAAPEVLPTTGADAVSLAPIGLAIFGVISMGIGVTGYAIRRRRSA